LPHPAGRRSAAPEAHWRRLAATDPTGERRPAAFEPGGWCQWSGPRVLGVTPRRFSRTSPWRCSSTYPIHTWTHSVRALVHGYRRAASLGRLDMTEPHLHQLVSGHRGPPPHLRYPSLDTLANLAEVRFVRTRGGPCCDRRSWTSCSQLAARRRYQPPQAQLGWGRGSTQTHRRLTDHGEGRHVIE